MCYKTLFEISSLSSYPGLTVHVGLAKRSPWTLLLNCPRSILWHYL